MTLVAEPVEYRNGRACPVTTGARFVDGVADGFGLGFGAAGVRVTACAAGRVTAAGRATAAEDVTAAGVVGVAVGRITVGSVTLEVADDLAADVIAMLLGAAATGRGDEDDGPGRNAGRAELVADGARALASVRGGAPLPAIPTTTTAHPTTAAHDTTDEATRPNDMAISVPCLMPV